MSPGAVEEGAKTARSFFDAMKEQPLALALAIICFALIGYLYFEHAALNSERKGELDLLYQNRQEVALLLAQCHWPEGVPLPDLSGRTLPKR